MPARSKPPSNEMCSLFFALVVPIITGFICRFRRLRCRFPGSARKSGRAPKGALSFLVPSAPPSSGPATGWRNCFARRCRACSIGRRADRLAAGPTRGRSHMSLDALRLPSPLRPFAGRGRGSGSREAAPLDPRHAPPPRPSPTRGDEAEATRHKR
jgi:hypothetical protein